MKFIHLSDLHLGKRLNEFSLIEDQRHILTQITSLLDKIKPDGIIIAGDVYDKSVPSTEAVNLLDDFLYNISQKSLPIYLIGGNHDSQERLSFGGRMFSQNNIFISQAYNGNLEKISLKDAYGDLDLFLLPFVKPSQVKRFFTDKKIETYTDAIKEILNKEQIDFSKRNLLVTHQFVLGATTCESEELSVGGTDGVNADVFKDFDYVALGHIHSPQNVKPNIRYCGTPLKYSFSECNHSKSITIVELKEKGNVEISLYPLTPIRDLREIRGSYQDVTLKSNYQNTNLQDYVKITLTDEETILDGLNILRVIYPNIMKLEYDNSRTRQTRTLENVVDVENKSPMQLFSEFFETLNNKEMSQEQKEIMLKLINQIWEEQV